MENIIGKNDMILLFDFYNTYCRDLLHSFQVAGYCSPAVVIEENGFLPDDMISVYGYFMGDYSKSTNCPGKPRYFNEISVPEYWEISGNNGSGKVHDLFRERGRIFYSEPSDRRLVNIVDWLDERGVVRYSDHYNRYGAIFARTTFNNKGQKVNKSYFSPEGKEIIVENYVTGDIILNRDEKILIFHTKTEFVLYFLEVSGLNDKKLFYNSLSTPFFVSQRRAAGGKQDILFWQEAIGDEIPGNMQIILNGTDTHTSRIFVQKKDSYERLINLGANPQIVEKCGFVYPWKRENQFRPQALICTNSDQIEHCRELAETFPEMHFHIAALTEMSSKLMSMSEYSNVTLYPGIQRKRLENLFAECDLYFDVNYESEIAASVQTAFENNQLIFAFQETVHNRQYIAPEHIYNKEAFGNMVSDVQKILKNQKTFAEQVILQQNVAMHERKERFQVLFK